MAQKQERRGEMKKISPTTSGRGSLFARFLLFARLRNRGMTCPGLGMKAFGPARRFSTQLCPTGAKGWAEPVALAPTSEPSSGSPTVDSTPPPEDEPAPADCERRRRCASSVACVGEYSAVAHPRATPVCQSDSHAHASSASDTSG